MNVQEYQLELDALFDRVQDLWNRASDAAELDEYPDMVGAIDHLGWALVAISESTQANLKHRPDFDPGRMPTILGKPIKGVRNQQAYWRAWAHEQHRKTIEKMDFEDLGLT